jgi:signal transduction histidine kinase
MIVALALIGVVIARFSARQRARDDATVQLRDVKRALDRRPSWPPPTSAAASPTPTTSSARSRVLARRAARAGPPHHQLGPPRKEFIRDLWVTIANGEVWHGELQNRAKDGHPYWVDTTIVPFLDERGKPFQYIAIRADITARKQAEERLRQQAALARVGQMAAVVAHEVRNPLAGIKGAMQVLIGRRARTTRSCGYCATSSRGVDSLNDSSATSCCLPGRDHRSWPTSNCCTCRRGRHDGAARSVRAGLDIRVEGDAATVRADADLVRATCSTCCSTPGRRSGGRGRVTSA